MGAVVQLFNRVRRPIERVLTKGSGEFGFQGLLPDVYSIRVTLSSFMPALIRNITIQPGATSVLAINLASVLGSVELVYSSPNRGLHERGLEVGSSEFDDNTTRCCDCSI